MFNGFDDETNDVSHNANNVTTTVNIDEIVHETKTAMPVTENTFTPRPLKPLVKLKDFKKRCPENDFPASLGTYEIPTYRDLVLFTSRTLLKMFHNYDQKTLLLLKDMKEATTATREIEKTCAPKNRSLYKKCVKRVGKTCVSIIKELVLSKEEQKQAVAPLLEGATCDMTTLKVDPILLIKILAMDVASLEFALPAFLRLIGGCSSHCPRQSKDEHNSPRRLRHMTDLDLVVRHFLTNKNYTQLIMEPDLNV